MRLRRATILLARGGRLFASAALRRLASFLRPASLDALAAQASRPGLGLPGGPLFISSSGSLHIVPCARSRESVGDVLIRACYSFPRTTLAHPV